jgi:hypothetical protein
MREEQLHSREEARLDLSGRILSAADVLALLAAGLLLALSLMGLLVEDNGVAEALTARMDTGLKAREVALTARSFDGQAHFQRMDAARAQLKDSYVHRTPAGDARFRAFPAPWLEAMASGGNLAFLARPDDLVAEPGFGAVTLRWKVGSGGTVPAVAWVISRSTAGGEYQLVGEVPAATLEFVDRVPAGVEHHWRVASRVADPRLHAELGLSQPSSPARGMSLSRTRWSIIGAEAGIARVRIEAWTGAAFEAREIDLAEGSALEVPGAGPDWATGCRIEGIRMDESTRRQEVLRVVFDAEGRVLLDGREPRREAQLTTLNTRRFEVSVKTAEGKIEKHWIP